MTRAERLRAIGQRAEKIEAITMDSAVAHARTIALIKFARMVPDSIIESRFTDADLNEIESAIGDLERIVADTFNEFN